MLVAGIVTYNRLGCLKRCVAQVRAQSTRVDRILVVDNGSEDGTAEWLSDQCDVEVLRQGNEGSAGGQYRLFKHAYAAGADFLWTMDDDGVPGRGCLEALLEAKFPGVISPVPRDLAAPECLAFNLRLKGERIETWERFQQVGGGERVIPGKLFPFNGVLVKREQMERVGYPNRKMFIWGDDLEWYLRCQRAGVAVGASTQAEYLHPRERVQILKGQVAGRELSLLWAKDAERRKIVLRNQAWNWRMELDSPFGAMRRCLACSILASKHHSIRVGAETLWSLTEGYFGKLGKGQIPDV